MDDGLHTGHSTWALSREAIIQEQAPTNEHVLLLINETALKQKHGNYHKPLECPEIDTRWRT